MEPPEEATPPRGGPVPTEETGSETPRTNRFEQWDVSMPVPAPKAASPRRSNILTTTGAILIVLGVFVGAIAAVFVPGGSVELAGSSLSEGLAIGVFAAIAMIYIVAGVLVLLLVPAGRVLGVVVGAAGVLLGLLQLPSSGVSGLPTIFVNVFVIWSLASGGEDFRRG
jgi:hypothetical protein